MQQGVGVARHPQLRDAGRRGEPLLGHHRDDVEVRPPQRADDAGGEQRREHGLQPELDPLRADADGDDRLAEGDDHHQPEALGEVARVHVPALDARGEHEAVVEDHGEHPEHVARRAVEGGAGEDDQAGARDQRADEREHDAREVRVAARGEGEERGVQQPHREVPEPPQQPVVAEGAGVASATISIAPIAANITSRGSRARGRRCW